MTQVPPSAISPRPALPTGRRGPFCMTGLAGIGFPMKAALALPNKAPETDREENLSTQQAGA
ncbi:hypothetical protein BOSE46_70500 [Bosea sp. 46]|nr:hypothetical protein BOSE46_70500 [Bosea sp. 46]